MMRSNETISTMSVDHALTSRKKGFMARFRLGKRRNAAVPPVTEENRDQSPSPQTVEDTEGANPRPDSRAASQSSHETSVKSASYVSSIGDDSRDSGSHHAHPADYNPRDVIANPRLIVPAKKGKRRSKLPQSREIRLMKAPTARDSAFDGPPRYDWIDIETHAAIKVQAAARRILAQAALWKAGKSTAHMRNQRRRRQVEHGLTGSEDIPSLFRCCGVGLAFGESTQETEEDRREHARAQYEARKKKKAEHESSLRRNFGKSYKAKYFTSKADREQEAFEVVE